MASQASFDISTGADLQEVDNAVNQAQKEIIQRYDFKGSKASIAFDRPKATLTLVAVERRATRSHRILTRSGFRHRAQIRELSRMKLGVISLGCDKATVDSERLVGELVGHGAVVTPVLPEADVILVNTCGFIDAAKQESIDAILAAAKLKESGGGVKAVVAVGCLVQRYKQELTKEIPEVDLFLGFSELHHLIPELAQRGLIADPVAGHPGVRQFLGTQSHVRYLKISEGCDHTCAFCAIPLMRGKHRSESLAGLVREAPIVPCGAMPIQHASDRMLERMRRPERMRTLREKLAWLRGTIPDLAIRTTCLVGFPGETEADFRTLVAFLEEAQFDRMGAFAYSPQEGTRAANYEDDVPDAVKRERLRGIVEIQRVISGEQLSRFVGREVDVLVDRVSDPDENGATHVGRVQWQGGAA